MRTYQIITLGASGAGKTVFLASLFKQLSTQGNHGFFLDVKNNSDRKLLNQYYTEIITGEAWPKSTKGSPQEWTFTCFVKTPDLSIHPACQFIYKDYPGGLLLEIAEDEFSEYNLDFNKEVENADAVLAILDGQKVLQFLKRDQDNLLDIWKHRELTTLTQLIQRCKKIPVHFIISKWDLIENHGGFNLEDVRLQLNKQISEFKNVVQQRKEANCPIRLIPVSSVGDNFATYEDGVMKKNLDVIPAPFQVEVPLACVLIDGLKVEINKIKEQHQKIDARKTEVSQKFGLLGQVNNLISGTVLDILSANARNLLPDKYKFDNDTLNQLFKMVDQGVASIEKQVKMTQKQIQEAQKAAARESEKLHRQRDKALKKINSEEQALNHVINRFIEITKKLDQDFPSSNLGGSGI